ncbi:Ankyrin repeat containing protein [Coccidioides posadasii C735 delta SOWgp]|uniref:Ankyrin repeat containing protein n=1 Tax=Coccidioides posadasii (strain C735) TaxID=222929 RepID=C5PCC9_COCP7|nr:Ankyrin repeat containing protein [Coccidioides posadasii C735 delta SOWgp]EER25606.1 Ankyrin repeat containing protein [Coccidioides posadasii C735 delta SOWgp]|eukprot:XP_003067751.1 Ankyrin repeat containing protein [Coccidioides posadasii C735 delta SOWgp]
MEPVPPTGPVELASLPNEILLSIADYLDEPCIGSLASANSHLNTVFTPYLYARNVKRSGASALWWAIKRGERATAQKSLDAGADLDAQPPLKYRDPFSAGHFAAYLATRWLGPSLTRRGIDKGEEQKRADLLLFLIDNGMSVDAKCGNDASTVVQHAARVGNDELVFRLIDKGADINVISSLKQTLLHDAAKLCKAELISLLINRGLDIHARDGGGFTPLHQAALGKNEATVRTLIERGADINCTSNDGASPLLLAAAVRHSGPVIELLVRNGADVNHRAHNQATPLHIATDKGYLEVVLALVEHGANVDVAQHDGNTPLHFMLRLPHSEANLELIKLLIKKGADVNSQNNRGASPLHTAAATMYLDAVRLLVEHGAAVNKQDALGFTALHFAGTGTEIRRDLATILLENGADMRLKNNSGFQALNASLWQSRDDNEWIEKALAKFGGNDQEANAEN